MLNLKERVGNAVDLTVIIAALLSIIILHGYISYEVYTKEYLSAWNYLLLLLPLSPLWLPFLASAIFYKAFPDLATSSVWDCMPENTIKKELAALLHCNESEFDVVKTGENERTVYRSIENQKPYFLLKCACNNEIFSIKS